MRLKAPSSVSVKGVIVGVLINLTLSVVLGFVLFAVALMSYDLTGDDVGSGSSWMALYALAYGIPPLVAGYVAAAVAGKGELINGTLVGTLCATIAFLFTTLFEEFRLVDIEYVATLALLPVLSFIGACLYLIVGWPKSSSLGSLWSNGALRIAAQIMIALAGGLALMTALGIELLPIPGAWPVLAIFCYALMGCVSWFHRLRDAPFLAAAAFAGLFLQGVASFQGPTYTAIPSQYVMLGAAAGAALVGYFAKRRFLLALVIGIPPLVNIQCLFCLTAPTVLETDSFGAFPGTMLAVPLAALVGAGAAHLARRFQCR